MRAWIVRLLIRWFGQADPDWMPDRTEEARDVR